MLLAGLAGDLNDEQKDYLKTILEKGESLLRLISSILDLSRIEARGVQLVRKPTGLDDIVQSAMESVLPQSLKKNLQLKSEVSRTVKNVTVDSDKIRQCVVNLLSNSVKFTPAGGQILIQAGPAERPPTQSGPFGSSGTSRSRSRTTDRDRSELQSKVFETFFQADSSPPVSTEARGSAFDRPQLRRRARRRSLRQERARQGSTFTMIVPIEPPGSGLEMRGIEHGIRAHRGVPEAVPRGRAVAIGPAATARGVRRPGNAARRNDRCRRRGRAFRPAALFPEDVGWKALA